MIERLATLPRPQVIEEIDFADIKAAKLADLRSRHSAYSATVESDPAAKVIEVNAYREVLVRARINDAARSRLLYFAKNGDLDHDAAFYGVFRLPGELDDSLLLRVVEATQGSSAAGTSERYAAAARAVSLDVADVAVDAPQGGRVRVSVLSRIGDGTPSVELLNAVRSVVTAKSRRALCHGVEVVGAEILQADAQATIKLLPDIPNSVFTVLEATLRAQWLATRGLGRDLEPSWLIAALLQPGVKSVALALPVQATVAAANQCVALRNVTLTLGGHGY